MIKQIAFVLFILIGLGVGYLFALHKVSKQDKKIKEHINEKELIESIKKDLERDITILNKQEVKNNDRTNTNNRGHSEAERTTNQDNKSSTDNSSRESSSGESGRISLSENKSDDTTNRNDSSDIRSINWA